MTKDSLFIVTGGAGFIGSNIVRMLNTNGFENILIVDHLTTTGKWKNLTDLRYANYLDKSALHDYLETQKPTVEAIIHIGACSATTEPDENYLMQNNALYTRKLMEWSAEHGTRLIYASSAATYGDGSKGYSDTTFDLKPLNCYGYSKHLADQWMLAAQSKPTQWVGLKFFNVYGPHEDHKGQMASVIYHGFFQVKKEGEVKLFKSYKEGYGDGEQKRDFVYVKDIVRVIEFFLTHPDKSGIFNVGTGKARTFYDLAKGLFTALGKDPNITFIDMPETLQGKYQYFTEADMHKLRDVGYTTPFFELEDGIKDYVTYLEASQA